MRNYTASGELKTTGGSGGNADGSQGEVLAAGYLSPLTADTDGLATLQALQVAADADGIALSQAPSSGVPLTLEAAAANLRPPRKLTFTSAGDLSGVDFTIVGTDHTGSPANEVIAGPNATTVTTSTAFRAVSSITPDATDAATLTVGWPASDSVYPLILEPVAGALNPARTVSLTSSADLSGVDFTVSGLDEDSVSATEVISGPNNNTVRTEKRFSVVTAITPSELAAGQISAGWPGEPQVLYAPEALVALSHIFLRNTAGTREQVELSIKVNGESLPWRLFSLDAHESASVLYGESPLPLGPGQALEALTGSTDVIAYLIYGARQQQ